MKCMYKLMGAGTLVGATYYILKHCQEHPGLIAAFNGCVMPTGTTIIGLSSGCVRFTIQAERLSALKSLWEMYENGSLQKCVEDHFVIDAIKKMAMGKKVQVEVSIDQKCYKKAYLDLLIEEQKGRPGFRFNEMIY